MCSIILNWDVFGAVVIVDLRDSATAELTNDGEEVCARNYTTEESTGHYHCCHRLLSL